MILFGFLPTWVHHLEVVSVNESERVVQTAEKGGPLRRWDHTLSVAEDGDSRCVYTDIVHLEAGLLTPLAWLLATVFFQYRQMRLRNLVRR